MRGHRQSVDIRTGAAVGARKVSTRSRCPPRRSQDRAGKRVRAVRFKFGRRQCPLGRATGPMIRPNTRPGDKWRVSADGNCAAKTATTQDHNNFPKISLQEGTLWRCFRRFPWPLRGGQVR